jgi:hypothetical protein
MKLSATHIILTQGEPLERRCHMSPHSAAKMCAFATAEHGNMSIFGVMMGALMIAFGGFAVDMMRYEAVRAELMNTLDRAALASASFSQDLVPEDVVEDYFAKAGLSDQLVNVITTQGLNFRRVDAFAEADTKPFFLNMVGLDNLHVSANSAAEQRITNVEVMLVLDVSGSMNTGGKIEALRVAARDFVDTVLQNDVDDKISIGIVPFNGQVNLGLTLRNKFNATHQNTAADVNCVDLPASVYTTTGISLSTGLPMTADVDTFSGTDTGGGYSTSNRSPSNANKWCPPQPTNVVRLPGQDIATLQGHITGLTAIGATSINAGMKWGLTLLDPGMRATYNEFILASAMPAALTTRPFEYEDEEAMKVIILMTDGEHFAEERLVDAYKAGTSPIWSSAADGNRSIFHSGLVNNASAANICNSRPFWVPHLGRFHSRAWNGTAPVSTACYVANAVTSGTTAMSWQAVWDAMRLTYVVQQFYVRGLGGSYWTYMDMFRTKTPTATMDTQLQTICGLAKAQNVIVYGIAFQAPSSGQTQIQGCATSMSYYYEAESNENLKTAFKTIANNISQLRLVQ